jgi:ribosome maturation protein SDO1
VDPKTHVPHPIMRIEAAMEQARVSIDPHKRAEDQAKDVIDALRAILPLKSETVKLIVKVPPQFAGQSYSAIKGAGELKGEEWLSDGSLRVVIEMNASLRGTFIDRLGSVTKGSAEVKDG